MFSTYLEQKNKNRRKLMYIGLVSAVLCVVGALASGFGYQGGFWHFRTGFQILKWSFFLSVATLIFILGSFFFLKAKTPMDWGTGLIGLVICLVMIYVPYSWKRTLDAHPYIHDISTDLNNPPEFVAAISLRGPDDHPVEYDGPEVAEQQRTAYPDINTLTISGSKEETMNVVEGVIKDQGMEVVDTNAQEGRIEAVATSGLYGFKDDVVVRILESENGQSMIDIRSKSRVGKSDLGQNAKRIRKIVVGVIEAFER
jgi:uncharacterized protein (DUF1499 family)